MAWVDFYMGFGLNGNALAAGTDASGTGTELATNGAWNSTTRTFTAASGTPFSALSVGQWVSVYTDAATNATYVAEVTSKTNTTFVTSATNKLGTVPTTAASGMTIRQGGAWNTTNVLTNLWNTGTLGVPSRLNIPYNSAVFTAGANNFTIGVTSGPTTPLWVRGFTSAAGDLDGYAPTGNRPTFTFTSGVFTFNSTYSLVTNINITSQRAGGAIVASSPTWFHRCSFINTSSNSASGIFGTGGGNGVITTNCYLQGSSGSLGVVNVAGLTFTMIGCWVKGGVNGFSSTTGAHTLLFNVFEWCGTRAIFLNGAFTHSIIGCNTFNQCGGTGIESTTAPATGGMRAWFLNELVDHASYGIRHNNATSQAHVPLLCNYIYGSTTDVAGFGDWPHILAATGTSYPLRDITSDYRHVANADTKNANFPGMLNTDYPDVVSHPAFGAIQPRQVLRPLIG